MYEYCIAGFYSDDISELSALGTEGWEVIGIYEGKHEMKALLKRLINV